MPFYLLSSNSHIKNDIFKFGYSSKSKNELLIQYEKNKRTIPNPFIIQWWDVGLLKTEKKIHNVLRNMENIENVDGEWYKCNNLLYFLTIINNEIKKNQESNEHIIKNNQKIIKKNKDNIFIINNIEDFTLIFLKLYFNDSNIDKYKNYIIKELKKENVDNPIDERIIQKEYKYDKSNCKKCNSKLNTKDYYLYCKNCIEEHMKKPQTCFINNCQNEKHNKIPFCKNHFDQNLNENYNSEDEYEDIELQ